jgi:SAM-dependent methyltransferase
VSGRDPTARFSDRVDSYVRARPGYPPEVLDVVERETGLTGPSTVADVGSGTGIFTRMLLERGHTVYAVEPNEPMRRAAEATLSTYAGFHSVDGRAEHTTLADAAVDLATAAQAFHWFDRDGTRAEWMRILRPPRWAALLWNDRRSEDFAFGRAYEEFLQKWGGAEYQKVRWSWAVAGTIESFFGSIGPKAHAIPNLQALDLRGLEGRLLSSSYLPGPDDPRRDAMLEAARTLFEQHQSEGTVTLEYETRIYVGKL